MRVRHLLPPLGVLLCLACLACTRHTVPELRGHVAAGRLEPARTAIEDLYPGERNRLIRSFELGLANYYCGDFVASDRCLKRSATFVDYFRSGDFLESVGTWTLNDRVAAYSGDAFEHIQVHYHHALGQLLMAQHQAGFYAPVPGDPDYPDQLDAHRHYQQTISYARAMVLSELPQTEFAAARKRYIDDPFARVLAAALVYALPARISTDLQYANNQLKLAAEAYREEAATLTGDAHFRYETDPANQVFATLLHRHCRAYDAEGFAAIAADCPPPAPVRFDPAAAADLADPAALPAGHGMVLVLHHAGFVAHPETLQIGIVHHKSRIPDTAVRFGVGGAAFWATGPGQDVVKAWGAFPVPDKLVDLLAPGGGSWIKFELPVHAPDAPVPPPAELEMVAPDDGRLLRHPLAVCSDLDAYARATLKDNQPKVLVRTLIRGLAKQAAVAAGAQAAKERGGEHAGLLAYGINVVGSIAASLTELADLRSVNLLPDRIEGLLVDAPAGSYQLHLRTARGTLDLGRVRVPAGRLVVVPARTFE